jgi:DNA polymerase elongation subunit (family B)
MKVIGWLLGVDMSGDYLKVWIKKRDGQTVFAFHKYLPSFYAQPKRHFDMDRAHFLLNQHPFIKEIEVCKRYVSVSDKEKTDVFRVWPDTPRHFKKTIQDIEDLEHFKLYNIDVPITQTYFYENDLFPMALCEFDINEHWNPKQPVRTTRANPFLGLIRKIILHDKNTNVMYEFPRPLRMVNIDLGKFGLKENQGSEFRKQKQRPMLNEPLISIRIALVDGFDYEAVSEKYSSSELGWVNDSEGRGILVINVEKATEVATIRALSREIQNLDPDIILTQSGDEYFFPYLVDRASANNCSNDLILSRDLSSLKRNMFTTTGDTNYFSYGQIMHRSKHQFYLRGRICIDKNIYGSLHFSSYTDGNIQGIIEMARVSRVPLQRLTRVTIGGALQSIQFYIAGQKGYLIPPEKKNAEGFQTVQTLLYADRGGHIFEPKIGVFEQVIELDFTSMYPMIMSNYNVSPDTFNCECCKEDGNKVPGLPFHTCIRKRGIVSDALELPLRKRRAYKTLSRALPENEAKIYKKMSDALKWPLVCSFGYLGFKNARFGKVEGHQAVCAYSRELLLVAQELAESREFSVLHGIVDSMWLQHQDHKAAIIPDREDNRKPKLVNVKQFWKKPSSDYLRQQLNSLDTKTKELTDRIQDKIRIPIVHEATYKFIVFLPSRIHSDVPVLNHYWGVTYDGKIKVRGIEIRRRDAPRVVKEFQQEIIDTLSSAESICEFMDFLSLAKKKFKDYCRRIESEEIDPDKLTIVNRISKRPEDYKVNSYQAVAANQLKRMGIQIEPGQKVEYILRNASAKKANERVVLRSEFNRQNRMYDKEKYKELLKRAFENVVPFDIETIADVRMNENGIMEYVFKENSRGLLDKFMT